MHCLMYDPLWPLGQPLPFRPMASRPSILRGMSSESDAKATLINVRSTASPTAEVAPASLEVGTSLLTPGT
jgi:hypothetical protein